MAIQIEVNRNMCPVGDVGWKGLDTLLGCGGVAFFSSRVKVGSGKIWQLWNFKTTNKKISREC